MTSEPQAAGHQISDAQLRSYLVHVIADSGSLRSEAWKSAFADVPRHLFVPSFFRETGEPGKFDLIDGSNPGAQADWLKSVYDDEVLYTQIGSDGTPLSSSTVPSLMALMLEALEVETGMNILEIGTGTGYNTALLCHRLGSPLVTSLDIDPGLIDTARPRLAALGYTPRLEARDGSAGYPPGAPYDRIIATVAVPAIPAAWLSQARDGGRILANLYRELGGGALACLTVRNGRAEGRFLPDYGGFMPIRAIRPPAPVALFRAATSQHGTERETPISGQVLDNPAFAFFAALHIPAQSLGYSPHDGPDEFWLFGADRSWARQTTSNNGTLTVTQHGPRMLWDNLEQARHQWLSLGSPQRHDIGLTIQPDGTHTLWHTSQPGTTWALALEASDP